MNDRTENQKQKKDISFDELERKIITYPKRKKEKKSYIIHEIPFAFPFLIGNGRGVKRSQMGQRR